MAGEEVFVIEDAQVIRETEKALLVRSDDLQEETWIPKSQIHDDSDVFDSADGSQGRLIVTEWFAIKQGWT